VRKARSGRSWQPRACAPRREDLPTNKSGREHHEDITVCFVYINYASGCGSLVGAENQCSVENPGYLAMWNCIRGTVAQGQAGLMNNAQAVRYMAVGDALAERVKAGQMSDAQAKAQLAVELERDNEAFEATRHRNLPVDVRIVQ
jgi:hypothetical protein